MLYIKKDIFRATEESFDAEISNVFLVFKFSFLSHWTWTGLMWLGQRKVVAEHCCYNRESDCLRQLWQFGNARLNP